ncbi:MAG: hypothetical protein HRU38_04215 [Saccharospirillaceae bacterium]|nr:hypothetical protein [Pseudomonadales bacterium]NRB77867.1 hypothetical protein [Saccharospirillaceae bacterium]
MNLPVKVIFICISTLISTFSLADGPAVQFTYGKSFSQGAINYEKNSDKSNVTENFIIEGQSINLKYIYSPFTAISLSYHRLESCKIENAKTKLGCHIDTPIEGINAEFLTGLNMDGKGLFLFTGVGYYIEELDNTKFEEFYIPVGIGVNLNIFVIEATYEFRNAAHYDTYDYSMFSEIDSDYTTKSEQGIVASIQPITISLGVRF